MASETQTGANAAAAPNFVEDYVADPATTESSDIAPFVLAAILPPSPMFLFLAHRPDGGIALETAPRAFTTAAATSAAAGPIVDDYSDQAVNGDIARSAYGVTGDGIKVGILSDSFDVRGGYAQAVANGELPANVDILKEGPAGSTDEGQAMAELIHQIAPDAQIDFYTAADGEADFANGIDALVAAGCNVIVDDVTYLDEPFFQDDGVVQTAVQQAIADGVSYFTAAGNAGNDYIQQDFSALPLVLPGLPAGSLVQNFGTAAAPQPWLDVTIPSGGVGTFDLQWDQPYGDSADSLGMALYDANGNLLASATVDQTGGTPDQILSYTNTGDATSFRLVLYMNGGAVPPGLFKIIAFGNGGIDSAFAGTGSGSVLGQEMVPGANTVGAMDWSAAPRFGGSDTPESFSSVGDGTFLFSPDGTPLAQPEVTQKVDFLAPDDSLTSVLAPFYGTSAAAANAAGVAALVLQADPWLTPAQLTQVLEQTATAANGATEAVGAGLLNASAAVEMALGMVHGT